MTCTKFSETWSRTTHPSTVRIAAPHDVIGINSVASFWDRLTDEHKVKMNELAAVAAAEWDAL